MSVGARGAPALTSQVLQYEHWTPDVLEAQQSQLVGLLVKEWDL
ncbi:hypothetical protein [Streptomyces virginiae]